MTLEGVIVSSPLATEGFFISDGTRRAFSGLWVQLEADALPQVQMGDVLTIEGRVAEHSFETPAEAGTRTELPLGDLADLEVTGQADLPEPVPVQLVDLGLADIAELYEGVVVRMPAASVSERFDAEGELLLEDIVRVDDLFVTFTWRGLSLAPASNRSPGSCNLRMRTTKMTPDAGLAIRRSVSSRMRARAVTETRTVATGAANREVAPSLEPAFTWAGC